MRYLPDNNLAYPARLSFLNGGVGSGFFVNYNSEKLFLVTAKHVLYKKYSGNELLLQDEVLEVLASDIDLVNEVRMKIKLSETPIATSDTKDVAVIYLGEISKNPNYSPGSNDKEYSFDLLPSVQTIKGHLVLVNSDNLIMYDDVLISNEVFTLGYPVSISTPEYPQIDYSKPLLRKGIVAGKNVEQRSIILDCPVYQGNSGGLVLQVTHMGNGGRRFQIIGLVSQFIPFFEVMQSMHHGYINRNLENSGYSVVVPCDDILDVIKINFTNDQQ